MLNNFQIAFCLRSQNSFSEGSSKSFTYPEIPRNVIYTNKQNFRYQMKRFYSQIAYIIILSLPQYQNCQLRKKMFR